MSSAGVDECVSKGGHLYERDSSGNNTWKCMHCPKRYTFDDESKGWK